MISISENPLLFDDLTALENKLGTGALKITSINTNCDCDAYTSTSTDNDRDPDQITPIALAAA
ncbi:MAG: hypothetical protein U0X91_00570 [Spirosomataceae bacterium]